MADASGASPPAPAALLPEPLRFERLLSDLWATFIDLAPEDFDAAVHRSLGRIVAALGIDRSTLSRVSPLTGRVEVTHSFGIDGVEPVPMPYVARVLSPWLLEMALANKPIMFEKLDEIPAEAAIDRETFRAIGLKSHVTMPLMMAGQLVGGLSFGAVVAERRWSAEVIGRMRLLADIFSSALARKHSQEALDNAIGFERLASSILASLALAAAGQENQVITQGLRQIGEFMGAERVALWGATGEPGVGLMRQWHAEGFAPPGDGGRAADLPWVTIRAMAGDVIRVPRLAELPPEAATDRAALALAGVRSLLVVPISASERVTGALSIACIERENEWPDILLPGVSLLAEVFASLHAREAAERRKRAAEGEAAHWRERLAHLVRVHTAGEMSVALAHEITQPLGAIENYALAARRRAAESPPDLERVVELIDKVIGQATRAGDVVMRMRGMVQRHALEPKPIDVERAVDECMGMVKMDCQMRDIAIHLLPAGPLPPVMVDEIHLQQVVLNLLRNAMDALEAGAGPSHESREIGISLERSGRDEIAVQVADRGIGIAEGDLERIFESFYSTKSSGLGVGLAICRKLIEAHGGTLRAAHNPGGGALFRFTLPVAAPAD